MQASVAAEATAPVQISGSAEVLAAVNEPGVELAAWQRAPDPMWSDWLAALPADAWPACRVELRADSAAQALEASFDARGTPSGPGRDAFTADVAFLVSRFSALARAPRVRLRLDMVDSDACRRWHRDCVPLRLVCTYRGPGTEWVSPADGPAVIARPDDDAPQALTLQAADVALFKGCGWNGHAHDAAGIVHRSPRIAGKGVARLVLVLDAAWPAAPARRDRAAAGRV